MITKHFPFVLFFPSLLYHQLSVFLMWKVTKYIYSITAPAHIQGALLEYFHFMQAYTFTPLHLTE